MAVILLAPFVVVCAPELSTKAVWQAEGVGGNSISGDKYFSQDMDLVRLFG